MTSKTESSAAPPKLTARELESYISPRQAAKLKGISEDTFRRHYRPIIKKMSPRRNGVKLGDLLSADYERAE
jgi:hypothetical protein